MLYGSSNTRQARNGTTLPLFFEGSDMTFLRSSSFASTMLFAALTLIAAASGGCSASHEGEGGGPACGPVTCDLGQVCCNPSCGICTGPGEGCIDLECAPDPCAAVDARGEGACRILLGYAWDGSTCAAVAGCTCAGAGCAALSDTLDACFAAHSNCQAFCGGIAGIPCAPGTYCDSPDGSYCGGDDSGGVCRPIPTTCPEPGGVPVCGCDGETYLTECSANAVGVDIAHLGVCEGPPPPPPPPPPTTRSMVVSAACAPTDGPAVEFRIGEGVESCGFPAGAVLTLDVWQSLEGVAPGTTFSLGSSFDGEGTATYCECSACGTPCLVLRGTVTIDQFSTEPGTFAGISYELYAGDGTSFSEHGVTTETFCPILGLCG